MTKRTRNRDAVSLVEIFVGLAVISITGVALIGMAIQGARSIAGSDRHEQATLAGVRLIDLWIAGGYAALARMAGTERVVDLGILDDPPVEGDETKPSETNIRPAARMIVQQLCPGLVRLELRLTFTIHGEAARGNAGLSLTRYVSDTDRGWRGS